MKLKKILSGILILFLLFPFLFLIRHFSSFGGLDIQEAVWAFKNSFHQAFLSSLVSLILGFWMSLGLCSISGSKYKLGSLFKVICLLPNFLPPLFILLAVLNAVPIFPMGILGVVFIHTLINAGLVATLLFAILKEKLSGFDELAFIEGASLRQFIIKGVLPNIKGDLAYLALFVFTICFSSFSIPLVVGGGRGTTVEVLIYEKMRLSNDWSAAVQLAIIQSFAMFLLAGLLSQSQAQVSVKSTSFKLLKMKSGLVPIAGISCLLIYGYLQGFFTSTVVDFKILSNNFSFFNASLGSLTIGILSGGFTFLGLLVVAFCWPLRYLERFLQGYVAPSTALACFALLMVLPNESVYPFFKIPLAFVLVNLTGFMRMGWGSHLQGLKAQFEMTTVMGASQLQFFKFVVLPQVVRKACFLSSLAAVWGCGDFAISRVLAHKDITLAMATESLLSSYRLHHAAYLSLGVILVSGVVFIFFNGVGYVLHRKLSS